MSEERRKILEMVASGKLSAEQAERLLNAVEETGTRKGGESKSLPKYLFIAIKSSSGDNVNVRIPLKLIRAGIKLTSLIPREAQEKIQDQLTARGVPFDLNHLSEENLDVLVDALRELEIDISGDDTVRIYCGDQ